MDYKKNDTIKIVAILLFCLVVLFSFTSCRTKKETSTTFIKDSIKESSTFTILKGSVNLASIKEPCNEDGTLRPIFYESSTGDLKTTVKDKDGSIIISQEQKTDTIYKDVYIYKDKIVEVEVIKEIEVKNPLNLWVLFYSILATLWILRKPLLKLILPL